MRAFFRGVAEEDLRAHPPADLAAAALAHLEFGAPAHGQPGAGRHRAGARAPPRATASHRALVRVVAPDMPFLVDSIGIVFSQMNIAVHLIVHPVLAVRRDARGTLHDGRHRMAATRSAESWQMIEIDRPRDEAQARELLNAACTRRSTTCARRCQISRAMLERVRAVANELDARHTAGAEVARQPKRAPCSPGCTTGISCSSATATTT